MARSSIVRLSNLDRILILAPERYDPRRTTRTGAHVLSSVATVVREQVSPANGSRAPRCRVVDTSDAREGVLFPRRPPIDLDEIGSAKKVVKPGDVIVSRLRPYLRQVAYVDDKIAENQQGSVLLVCSTEFFVLRSLDDRSVAFLVPFLLSDPIQSVLAASQEGGHHPRFNQATLESLPIPDWLIASRDEVSTNVVQLVSAARNADNEMRALVARCSDASRVVAAGSAEPGV